GDGKGSPEKGSVLKYDGNPRKGGFRAAMFVFTLMVSQVLYFMYVMHLDISEAATTTTNFTGSTFLLTILGGFISDSYISRLNTVLSFGLVEILGWILLTVQAHYRSLRPDYYNPTDHLHGRSKLVLYLALSLLALGVGGVRGALPALGADQFDRSHPRERKQLASFFNWLLLSITLGACVGVTVVVWVSINRSWAMGFFISMLLATVGFAVLAVGKLFFRDRVPSDSPLLRIIQVPVAAIRNWKLPLPSSSGDLYEGNEKEDNFIEEKLAHTDQFSLTPLSPASPLASLLWQRGPANLLRLLVLYDFSALVRTEGFLDRAAILPQGTPAAAAAAGEIRPWRVCSVTQVEECKIVTRMLPILLSTIIMNTCLAQLQTFSVEQGQAMDLRMSPHFNIPAASVPIIPLAFMVFLIPLYELLFVPFARRFTGIPSGITHLQRVGVGLVLSAVSMAAAGFVEAKRRYAAVGEGRLISVFWLSFQYGIFGIADMFTLVGLMEFFYSEAPAGMRSLSTSFSFLSLSLGYFLSTVLVNVINAITGKRSAGGQEWLRALDLNGSRLDLFYWFLAALSCLNFANYLFWASWYKYKKDESPDDAGNLAAVTEPPAAAEKEVTTDGEVSQGG
ncbi:hypothetical protein Taro_034369, partial [Colocasia esculenta]|nr:hypothetical protein [Colocasia esculenta]